jgi:hypothetical protein
MHSITSSHLHLFGAFRGKMLMQENNMMLLLPTSWSATEVGLKITENKLTVRINV